MAPSLRTLAMFLASVLLVTTTTIMAAERDVVRVAAPWEVAGPDPATDGYIFLRMGVMETLVDTVASGELAPGLATSWADSDNGLTWRFELRSANFHDGTTLTAESVVSALRRAASQPGPLSKVKIDNIKAEESTVVIALSEPFAALPAVLAHSSTVIAAPTAFDTDGKAVAAIGTGPFMVNELTPPQSLTTQRFDEYWGANAKLSTVTYIATKRAETRALMAESGDADLVFTLDPAGFRQLGTVEEVVSTSVAIPRVMLVKVNSSHPSLKDIKARRALSLAVDREGIAAGVIRFPDAAATQLFPPALADWHSSSLPALAYDPDAAKALLTELGWQAGDDGILLRDGERFSLTLRTFPDRPELPLVAAALQDQWRQIGVELNVSVSNYSEIPSGHQDGSLELALFARNYGVTADPIASVLGDFGNGGGDWGAMNWSAPDVATALQEIAATGDATKRAPLISDVAGALHTELPMIPVVWYQHTVSYSKDLNDVVIDPLERSYGLSKIHWAK